MEASQTAPATPDAPAEAPAQANEAGVITPEPVKQEESKTADLGQIGEQINSLQERFDSQFPKEEEKGGKSDVDLLTSLGLGDQPDQGQEPAPAENFDTDGLDWLNQDQPPQFSSQQELDNYVQEQAAAVLQPYAFQKEMDARRDSLGKMEEKYPDITDYVEKIGTALEARAQEYGIDPQFLKTDPTLVEFVYKGLKADEASSAEVDASDASTAGAALETGTGPGSPGSEQDPGEAFAQKFAQMADGGSKDAFS